MVVLKLGVVAVVLLKRDDFRDRSSLLSEASIVLSLKELLLVLHSGGRPDGVLKERRTYRGVDVWRGRRAVRTSISAGRWPKKG